MFCNVTHIIIMSKTNFQFNRERGMITLIIIVAKVVITIVTTITTTTTIIRTKAAFQSIESRVELRRGGGKGMHEGRTRGSFALTQ